MHASKFLDATVFEIKKHGISPKVMIEDLIYNYSSKPKNIHFKLNKKTFNVQVYIKNRRDCLGENIK